MKILPKDQGLYDPSKRFAWTNITTEDFVSEWAGVPVTVKAGQTIEINNYTPIPQAGHAMAVKMTKELTDQIIMGQAKLDEVSKNQPYYRSPIGMSLGVPAARAIWEDQIVRELDPEEESPALQTMRRQMIEEIQTGISAKEETKAVTAAIPTGLNEFADINKPAEIKVQKEAKVKSLEIKKIGRPRKVKDAVIATPAN